MMTCEVLLSSILPQSIIVLIGLPALLLSSTYVVCPMLQVFQELRYLSRDYCLKQQLKELNDLGLDYRLCQSVPIDCLL